MTAVLELQELRDAISKHRNLQTLHPAYLFRGQCNSDWSLQPSFSRIANKRRLDRAKAIQLEREVVNKFSISASKLLPLEFTIDLTLARFKSSDGSAIDFLGWFVLMQHYGAPTRTLDWSCSPWIALYFACSNGDDVDGSLWIADFAKVDKHSSLRLKSTGNFQPLMIDAFAPAILVFVMPFNTNERVETQQGRLSICTDPLKDHLPLLESYDAIEKIVIPRGIKRDVLNELAQMNISSKTLFPGVDGLGRSIHEYCNLWDASSTIK